jgi:hypothetical protein
MSFPFPDWGTAGTRPHIFLTSTYYNIRNAYFYKNKKGGVIMANYKPLVKTVTGASAASGIILPVKISTTSWGLLLVRGTAVFSNTILRSGAVAVWQSTNPTTAAPNLVTFSDANAIYGISTKAGVQLRFKFYAK